MHKFYLLILCLLMSLCALAKVQITELTACNYSSYMNTDNYNFSGYIEFYNDGDSTNLKGCVLTHYKLKKKGAYELKWQWKVDQKCSLRSQKYSVLWMDEEVAKNHAPYKLDKDGGYVTLYRDGVLLDSIAYGPLSANLSYGRSAGVTGYMEPTPYETNSAAHATIAARCQTPVFSVKGGVKTGPVNVSISCSTKNAQIYYTLNGSEPTPQNGKLYKSSIQISKNTPLRAKAYAEDMLSSKVTSASYLFEDEAHAECGGFTLPIISLMVDSAYFYDKTIGICVTGTNGIEGEKDCQRVGNYNRDWKRPVNFEYMVGETSVFSQDVEAAVEGGCSRSEKVKSLSLKASAKTGVNELNYRFFATKPDMVHQTVHVRNGGTSYSGVRFRDGLMQTFAVGMNIDYQAYQPVAYYINGKYQGLMALNERTNADYVTANYGYADDEIDLVTVSDQLGIRASKGDLVAYDELVSYLHKHSDNDSLFYAGACERMDMDEYIDYQIFQQFMVNTDWPGNNTKIWRSRNNGRFRWILFDTDFGLGLPGFEYLGKSDKNMINWCAGKSRMLQWANNQPWMTEIFESLYQNKQFKSKFVTKYLLHLSSTFSDEHIKSVFDSVTALLDAEYCAHTGGTSATKAARDMRTFALERAENIYSQLVEYTEGSSLVNLTIQSNVEGAQFSFNGEPVEKYEGMYIADYQLNLMAYPPLGYEFAGWSFDNKTAVKVKSDLRDKCVNGSGTLSATLLDDVVLTAQFVKTSETPTIVLNEICSSSNSESGFSDGYGAFPDWIELYNYGEKTVDLAGMGLYLMKSNGKEKISQLPLGSSQTRIKPGEHKVLWAKGDAVDGPLYLNFKIDMDDKPVICLVKGDEYLDCVDVMEHRTNESYGRAMDNDAQWKIFAVCGGKMTSTPNAENGTVKCTTTDAPDVFATVADLQAFPNPTEDRLEVVSSEEMLSVNIYDMMGRWVKCLTPNDVRCYVDLSDCTPGLYHLHVLTIEGVRNLKIQKK